MAGALPGTALGRDFFARPSLEVAPDLLGKVVHMPADGTSVRILEVEAYAQDEPACHAFRGQTAANATLFGPPGHLYVYFTYGMHHCINTVTGSAGVGEGVLLRAAAPLEGLEVLRQRRRGAGGDVTDRDLLRGPARLAKALGLRRGDDGRDLTAPGGRGAVIIADDGFRPPRVSSGPRVGVRLAADLPWRWWVADDPMVSDYRRHPKAAPPSRTT